MWGGILRHIPAFMGCRLVKGAPLFSRNRVTEVRNPAVHRGVLTTALKKGTVSLAVLVMELPSLPEADF